MLVVTALIGPSALADSVGPAGTWQPGESFGVLKTPRLGDTDTFQVGLSYHTDNPKANWAGVIVDIIIDFNPVEASFVGAGGAASFSAVVGKPPGVQYWHTQAMASGWQPQASVPVPLGTMTFHATNTDPAYNSEATPDIKFSAWNIWHVTTGMSTQQGVLYPSMWVYVGAGQEASDWGYGTEPQPGQGTWVHVAQTKTVHLVASWFWATATSCFGEGGVDVMHIPEPISGLMLLGGLGAFITARRRRR
jgi:hypothetical protein